MIPYRVQPARSNVHRPWVLEVFQDGRWQFVKHTALSSLSTYLGAVIDDNETQLQRDGGLNGDEYRVLSDPAPVRVYNMTTLELRWEGCWSEFVTLNKSSPECVPFAGRQVEHPVMRSLPIE